MSFEEEYGWVLDQIDEFVRRHGRIPKTKELSLSAVRVNGHYASRYWVIGRAYRRVLRRARREEKIGDS